MEVNNTDSTNTIVKGNAHKYGDNIDTDVIIPARFLNTADPEELKLHCLEDLDKDFINKVNKGDIIVGGKNFGCGSSREHAPIAIKAAGISCVIAESFSRIFFRNAINIGLLIIESKEAAKAINDKDEVLVDFSRGEIYLKEKGDDNSDNGKTFYIPPFPESIKRIIRKGGLINAIQDSSD